MAVQFNIRKESMHWTDKRAKLLMEILGAMRIVKYFTYELPFLKRKRLSKLSPGARVRLVVGIFDIRKRELKGVRKIQFARSAK